jgi:hypothetical protein
MNLPALSSGDKALGSGLWNLGSGLAENQSIIYSMPNDVKPVRREHNPGSIDGRHRRLGAENASHVGFHRLRRPEPKAESQSLLFNVLIVLPQPGEVVGARVVKLSAWERRASQLASIAQCFELSIGQTTLRITTPPGTSTGWSSQLPCDSRRRCAVAGASMDRYHLSIAHTSVELTCAISITDVETWA